jgi:CspA family cold shock protein
MGRGKDFRDNRRRGFDDDNFFAPSDYGHSMPRSYGSAPRMPMAPAAPSGPVVDAVVKWFNPEKRFGFAQMADGSGDAFLHVAVLEAAGFKSVAPGAKLKVRASQGQKGPQITEIVEIDESTAEAAPPPRRDMGMRSGGGRPRMAPDLSSAIEMTGTVKWYNPEKGFGFVQMDDGGKDVFVHASVLQRAGLQTLAEGQRVTMDVAEGRKGPEAVAIRLAD